MSEQEPEGGVAWAQEFLRRVRRLARQDSRLERIYKRIGQISRAVDAGELTAEQAVEALRGLEQELEAHRAEHAPDGEPARQRLADRMLELVEGLEERIRRRESGDDLGGG